MFSSFVANSAGFSSTSTCSAMAGFMKEGAKGQVGKRVTILSVDGGGVRGLIPASILTELESKLQVGAPHHH